MFWLFWGEFFFREVGPCALTVSLELNNVRSTPFPRPLMPQWQGLFYVLEEETPSRSEGLGFTAFNFLPNEKLTRSNFRFSFSCFHYDTLSAHGLSSSYFAFSNPRAFEKVRMQMCLVKRGQSCQLGVGRACAGGR